MTRRKFQNILIAVPYLLYAGLLIAVIRASPSIETVIVCLFGGIFGFMGLPFLIAFFAYMLFYKKLSMRGAFIIVNWAFLTLVFFLLAGGMFSRLVIHRSAQPKSSWHIEYTGAGAVADSTGRHFACNTVLGNSRHYCYLQTVRPVSGGTAQYLVSYYYNFNSPADSATIEAIQMQMDSTGKVLGYQVVTVMDDTTAYNDFIAQINFRAAVEPLLESAGTKAHTSTIDPGCYRFCIN